MTHRFAQGWTEGVAFPVMDGLLCDMHAEQPNNPLHGYTLQTIVESLVDYYGWEELGRRINIRCFNCDPSLSSSLKFLRKTPWARKQVEELFVYTLERYGE